MHNTLNTEADGLPSFLSVISVTIGNSTMSSLYETIYFRNERNFTGSSKERKFKKKRFIIIYSPNFIPNRKVLIF